MTVFAEMAAANAAYVASGRHVARDVVPARKLVIITCMDSRIDAFAALGLELGDAHVLRTAGARVTDDVLRSLAVSTGVLGTRNVVLLGHTRCGLLDTDGALETRLTEQLGPPPGGTGWLAFANPETAIRADCARLMTWPNRPDDFLVGGFLFDVDDGRVRPVVTPGDAPNHSAGGSPTS
ncbi:MAG: carbonic anhydrase [Nitriliruptoraceae bacterium]